uniref:Protein HIRA n=1 Tax=Loa loa TaxID=7209 RepID=A0A1I7VSX3_LOALO
MQLTNPVWIHHSGGAIYSVDIHPDGTKIATCGQGGEGGSGLVIIWNVKPVINEKASQEASCSRLLSRILHQNCVNCVRWSPDGAYLGCAGDQQSLTLWEFGGRVFSAGTIGSKDSINVEKYREKYRLYGHLLDVLHLEWSKDGRYLASCGMDHAVIIWDAHNLPNKVVSLTVERGGHQGIVKGVSWDPIGKFLATQSADKSVRIWTTDNWQCIKVVMDPFIESSQSTMFCRLDWSPDGTYLIAPCASNNSGPTAHLIRRKDWDTTLDLVGHRKAVTVVRACPRMIEYQNYKGNRLQVSCIAMGSRDKSLSVWLLPNVDRPLVVLYKLFKHSILDFSWNDYHLTICSMDGTVKSIVFDAKELGRLLTSSEMGDLCERMYSRRPLQYSSGQLNNGHQLLSSKDSNRMFVDDLKKLQNEKQGPKQSKVHDTASFISSQMKELRNSQTVVHTPVSCNPVQTDYSEKMLVSSELPKKQIELRTKSGKRRIQPAFIASVTVPEAEITVTPASLDEPASSSYEPAQASSVHLLASPSKSNGRVLVSSIEKIQTMPKTGEPMDTHPSTSITEQILPQLSLKPLLRPAPFPESLTVMLNDNRSVIFPIPQQRRSLSISVPPTEMCSINRIDVLNEYEIAATVKLTKLCGMKDTTVLWTAHMDPVVCSAAANSHWFVTGCYDGSIHIYSTPSGRLHTFFTIDSLPFIIQVHRNYLSVCSSQGLVYSWNIESRKCIMSRRSVADFCEKDCKVVSCILSDIGEPIITLSNGRTYSFLLSLDCWQLLFDEKSILPRLSMPAMSASTSALLNPIKSSPIHANSEVQITATHSFLEERLCSALSLKLPSDFRHYLNLYVRFLLQHGCTTKLNEILSTYFTAVSICGLKCDVLLREILELTRTSEGCSEFIRDVTLRLESLISHHMKTIATVPVHLILFGEARELANLSERNMLKELSPIEECCILALNQEYIGDHNETFTISAHSEIAVIPPISGG